MAKTLHSDKQTKLVELLIERRKAASMTQAEVARAMGRHQPFIANIENGERRIDLIELLTLAEIMRFDVHALISQLEGK